MTTAQLRLPAKLVPVFAGEADYRGAHGGRGSAKTRSFALMTAVHGYRVGRSGGTGVILCAREHLNSLDESSFAEVKTAIQGEPWLAAYYECGEKFIRSRDGRITYAFAGLRHNLDSIKSKARIILAWVDEAESVSEVAWEKLIPTVREEGAEIWATWNPESERSATHRRFRENPPPRSRVVQMNWSDNPFFPAILDRARRLDLEQRPDTYAHVWEGAFRSRSDAQVFPRVETGALEAPVGTIWRYGVDWGFAVDPTAGVRCCLLDDDRTLYIANEVYEHGVPMEALPALLAKLPGAMDWPMRADNARPETIDYVRRHGFPKLRSARKGKGSVEDGVEFLRGLRIVIHPACPNALREFTGYSYKVDPRTGDVLPMLAAGEDHLIDSTRYACEGLRRRSNRLDAVEPEPMPFPRPTDYGGSHVADGDDWKTA